MLLTYAEIKEDIEDSIKSLHEGAQYSFYNTFYATLEDYICHDSCTEAEECCVYVYFALLMKQKGENIDFLSERLFELINKNDFSSFKVELGDNYTNLIKDIAILKEILKSEKHE